MVDSGALQRQVEGFKALTQPVSCLQSFSLLFIAFDFSQKRKNFIRGKIRLRWTGSRPSLKWLTAGKREYSFFTLWHSVSSIGNKKYQPMPPLKYVFHFPSPCLFLNNRDPARYFPNCVSSGGNLGTVCTSDLSATPLNSATLPLPLVNGRIKWSSVGGRIHYSAVWVD